MTRQTTFDLSKAFQGFRKAAEAVAATIGPKGRNVYITEKYTPKITNDGATIANKIVLKDPEEDAGAYVIRNVSGQQNDDAGDGTTTVTILTRELVEESLKRPENPMEIQESLNHASKEFLKEYQKTSVPLKVEDIHRVALISSEDEHLATIIAEIFIKLGKEAVVSVDDSKTFETSYEIVEGYEAGVGYLSPHFVNDKTNGKAIFEDIPVLVTERKIQNIIDIKPLFDEFQKQQISQCVIVCDEIDDAMLGMFVANNKMGTFKSLVLRCGAEILNDIAGATGATIVSNHTGVTFANLNVEHLGKAKKVIATEHKTLFVVEPMGAAVHISELEGKLLNEPNQYVQDHLKTRIARLKSGIAQLKIGAATDFEREYLKLKADDAVKATKAALEEGVVEGGGFSLWRAAQALDHKILGQAILKKALEAPLRQIIKNAGEDYYTIMANLPKKKGWNAKSGQYVDMFAEGILDPYKVERCAVENAVSAAGQFITTACLITEYEDENKT